MDSFSVETSVSGTFLMPDQGPRFGKGNSKEKQVTLMDLLKGIPPKKVRKKLSWVYATVAIIKLYLFNSYHHFSYGFFQKYLDEFNYNLNRGHIGEKLFDRLLVSSLSFNWVT
ncbi:MAG: hypothetical protein D4R64_08560 [Porphyromonadaceae bacterium]|nr:MAG: hypothetical protein D4R64_08560 [Porphyromonadaceae bacterium]